MTNEEIEIKINEAVDQARKAEQMTSSDGWAIYQNIKNRKIAELKEKAFKSDTSLKKFEYIRGYIKALEDMDSEMQEIINEGKQKLTAKP